MAGNSTTTVYNSTDGPLIIDRAGRVLGARERLDVDDASASPIAGHIAAGRLVVIDQPAEDKAGKRRTSTTTTEEA